MKHLLLTTAMLAAIGASPAKATLQIAIDVNGTPFFCGEGMVCDTNPMTGTVQIAPTTLDGLFFAGEIGTAVGTPSSPGKPDFLNNSVLISDNTTKSIAHVTVAVSETGFLGPVGEFSVAGSGVWQNTIGSALTFKWFADPANAQGAATAFDTPGIDLATFTSKASLIVQGFSENNVMGPFSATGPFSMTLQSSYDLLPGGELVNRGLNETMTPIPEPATWVMLLLGAAFLGSGAAFRKRLQNY